MCEEVFMKRITNRINHPLSTSKRYDYVLEWLRLKVNNMGQ